MKGADLRAAFTESPSGGDFPPVVFRANCLIRAMVMICDNCVRTWMVGRVIWEGGNEGGREGGSFYLMSIRHFILVPM